MKAKQLLAGVVLVGVMAMGAGYAAWNQDFYVITDITAGQLSYGVTVEQSATPQFTKFEVKAKEYEVDVEIRDAYPGATFEYTIEIENTSTMSIHLAAFEHEAKEGFTFAYTTNDADVIQPNTSGTIKVTITATDDVKQEAAFKTTHNFIYNQFNPAAAAD